MANRTLHRCMAAWRIIVLGLSMVAMQTGSAYAMAGADASPLEQIEVQPSVSPMSSHHNMADISVGDHGTSGGHCDTDSEMQSECDSSCCMNVVPLNRLMLSAPTLTSYVTLPLPITSTIDQVPNAPPPKTS